MTSNFAPVTDTVLFKGLLFKWMEGPSTRDISQPCQGTNINDISMKMILHFLHSGCHWKREVPYCSDIVQLKGFLLSLLFLTSSDNILFGNLLANNLHLFCISYHFQPCTFEKKKNINIKFMSLY